jgi:hypothetical protein
MNNEQKYISLFHHRAKLIDVPSQHVHVAVFTISTCFESSTCHEEKVLDNTVFPKETCDYEAGIQG